MEGVAAGEGPRERGMGCGRRRDRPGRERVGKGVPGLGVESQDV